MLYSPNRIAYYRDRCRPPLTQRALARALGKHVNTIVLWEKHGVPAPADLLKLVELFAERGAIGDEATARQFWEVSGREAFDIPPELERLFAPECELGPEWLPAVAPPPAPVPACSLLPLHRNRLFVGRAAELRALAVALREPDATAVICGLGGMGKSQLACEFVHRYGQFFPGGVFWISFANPAALPAAVAACGRAEHMALSRDFESLPLDRQVRLVLAAWREPLPRLLIFDNCEDQALLANWRPPSGGCRVIATSRRSRWSPTLVTLSLPLSHLSRPESVALLQANAAGCPSAELDAVAGELGDLPLAIQLAGAYLASGPAGYGSASYLRELRAGWAGAHPSLRGGSFSPTGHEQHVARAFGLSYGQLRPDLPADRQARALLARAAHFAPGEPLPWALLLATVEPELAEAGLARLSGDLSLLELSGDALRLHRLVAGFVRSLQNDPAAQADVERALLAEAARLSEQRLPAPMLALQSHLRAVADAAAPRADERAARLCAELGWHLVLLDEHQEGISYIERSLRIREACFGPEHQQTAESLNLLGLAYQFPGNYTHARPLLERALAIWERADPADQLAVANGHANLGYLLFHLGEHVAARANVRRALRSFRQLRGLRDATTARILSNLGYVELRAGRLAAGRRYLKLALAVREQLFPANHPAIAQTLNNLGEALLAQGDICAAAGCHRRALAMREALFGADHPHITESLRNLARVLAAQGQPAAARGHQERALRICEHNLGERNIETGWNLAHLGELLLAQGEAAAARGYLKRAAAVYTELLSPGHHDILQVERLLAQSAQTAWPADKPPAQ